MSESTFLDELESVIEQRLADGDPKSYTVKLAESGLSRIAQKIGEEGVEVALAAVADDDAAIAEEAADLVYHLLVLLKVRGMRFADVTRVLARRHAT